MPKLNLSRLVEDAINRDLSSIIESIDSDIRFFNKVSRSNNIQNIPSQKIASKNELDKYLSEGINYMSKANELVLTKIKESLISINQKYSKDIIDKNVKFKFIVGTEYIPVEIDSVKNGYKVFNSAVKMLIREMKDVTNDHIHLLELTYKELSKYFDDSYQPSLEEVIVYYDKFNIIDGYKIENNNIIPIFKSFQGSSLIDEMLLENLESIKMDDLKDFLKIIESSQIDVSTVLRYLIGITNRGFSFFYDKKPWYVDYEIKCIDKGIMSNFFLNQFSRTYYALHTDEERFASLFNNIFQYNCAIQIPAYMQSTQERIDFIRDNIKMIIMKYNAIIEAYINAIKLNFSLLYLTYYDKYRRKAYKDALAKDRFKTSSKRKIIRDISMQELDYLNDLMRANLKSYIHYKGELLDFTDIGLGTVIIAPAIIKDKAQIYNQLKNLFLSSKLLVYLASFEITIITHGKGEEFSFIDYYKRLIKNKEKYGDYSYFCNIYYREINYLERLVNKPISEITGNELITLNINEFTRDNSFIIKINNKNVECVNGKIKKGGLNKSIIQVKIKDIYFNRWIIKPIRTPYREKPFTDMECLISRLLFEGYTRINCLVCNPEGIIFSNDIFKDKSNEIIIAIRNLCT